MPRKSAASLAVVPVATPPAPRLEPVRPLNAIERRHWDAVVSAVPPKFFSQVDAPALTAYVAHMALAEKLTDWLGQHAQGDEHWSEVNAAAVRHSSAALAWARGLRLIRNARSDRDRDARAVRDTRHPRAPWLPVTAED